MNEEFESFIRAQLKLLHANIETLRGYLSEYEERNRKLKKVMSEELIEALILRFERNEERLLRLDEKIDTAHSLLQEKLLREIKTLKNDMSEDQLSKAIARIVEGKEIKVDSRPLAELSSDY